MVTRSSLWSSSSSEEDNPVRSMASLVALRFTPADSPGSSSASRSSTTSAASHRTDGEGSAPSPLSSGAGLRSLGAASSSSDRSAGEGSLPEPRASASSSGSPPGGSDSSIPVMRCRTPWIWEDDAPVPAPPRVTFTRQGKSERSLLSAPLAHKNFRALHSLLASRPSARNPGPREGCRSPLYGEQSVKKRNGRMTRKFSYPHRVRRPSSTRRVARSPRDTCGRRFECTRWRASRTRELALGLLREAPRPSLDARGKRPRRGLALERLEQVF